MKKADLEKDLADLKTQRRKLVRDLEELDTKIIGIKLQLETIKEKERYQLDQDRSRDRNSI